MKKRIISAILMVLICLPFVLVGGKLFVVGIGIISILAYKEILSIRGLESYPKPVVVLGLIAMLLVVLSNTTAMFDIIGLNYKYLISAFMLMFLPTIFYYENKEYKYTSKDAMFLSAFIIFVGLALNIIMNLFLYELKYFILLLVVCICTDVFAYFTGVMIGKRKVTKISPNKSLEGFIGGVVMGTALSTILYVGFINVAPLYNVIPCLILLSLVCEIGDLFYSLIKRENNIKDFSNLIPGHGGILDRIDSLTFVVMVFVILFRFI